MQFKIFTVYDCKAEAYLPPFYMAKSGQAVRAFSDMANDPTHAFYKHAEDYTLFQLGVFDDNSATFDLHASPLAMCKAIEHKKQREMFMDNLDPLKLVDLKGGVA